MFSICICIRLQRYTHIRIRFTYIRSKDGRLKEKRPNDQRPKDKRSNDKRSKDKRSNDKRSNDRMSKDKRSKNTEHQMTERRIGPNVENDQNFFTNKFLKFFKSKTTKPILLDSLYTAAGKC